MKLYLVQVTMYDYGDTCLNVEPICNVYSNFKQAKEEGLKELKSRIEEIEYEQNITFYEMLNKEMLDYEFTIIEVDDLEYTENFDIEYKYECNFKTNNYSKLEPTHKTYYLDYKGNIYEMFYEYRIKNSLEKFEHIIKVFPEDLEEGASEKFKIGDIVKLKSTAEIIEPPDMFDTDRIYVVRYLPRKFNGEKYFENKYALISMYDTENKWGNKELFTFEYFEKDIEKYTGVIEKNSEYDLLSRILKCNLATTWEYWHDVKVGILPLNIDSFREANAENENDWEFYSTTITPRRTGLPVCIFAAKNYLGANIKDYLPKIRIQNKIDDYKDTFFISLTESPKVVIGENKLSEKDYKDVCNFVRKNLDILLKHFEPNDEFDDDDLWDKLKERGEIIK